MRRSFCFAVVVVSQFVAGGCSLGLAPPVVIAGRQFPASELNRLRRGAAVADIERIAGRPFESTSFPDGERWRYFMSVEQKEHVRLFNVVPLRPRRHVGTFETIFLIREGVVTDVISSDDGNERH